MHRGFDTFYGIHGAAVDSYTKSSPFCVDLFDGYNQVPLEDVDQKEHITNLLTRKAIEVIETHKPEDDPFFLYLSYTAPHDPLQADQEWIDKCSHITNHTRKMFCAMMLNIDSSIEKVFNTLKSNNLYDNTVIILTTDNGGMVHTGGNNYPYKGFKAESWEGGSRGPAFIHAPSYLFNSFAYEGLSHIADWLPTFLEISDSVSG